MIHIGSSHFTENSTFNFAKKNHLNSNNLNKSLTVKELYRRLHRREFWVYLPSYLKSLHVVFRLKIHYCTIQDLKRANVTFYENNKIKNKIKLLNCILQNIRTVECTEINAARQGVGANVRSPHDTSCASISYTILDQRSVRPVSLHGILGRFVHLRRSLN